MTSTTHVFHIVLSLGIGGLENGMVNLIRRSSPRFRHTLCCLRGLGPRGADLPQGVPIHDLAVPSGTRPSTVWAIARLLRRARPDLVRCYNVEALFHAVPAAALARRPVLYYNGGRVLPEVPRRVRLERWAGRRARAIVVPSRDLMDYMVREVGLPARAFRVIENGVDLERFRPERPSADQRAALGLPPQGPLIGAVGRLATQKDYPTLLEAFAATLATVPEARLVIAGGGPLRAELEARAAALGLADRVSFLGPRADMPALYQALDVFVSTSRWEGLSNVLLEAMATGLPAVATRVEGVARVITEEQDGLIVAPGDRAATSAALVRVLREPGLAARLGAAARAKVQREFSLPRMVAEYEALYDELLAQRIKRTTVPSA
jgi:sugar transferase (PEP-CTERM/EpsH1 system associated)